MSNIISVSQFNNYVHNIFVAEILLQNISIFGEVSALSWSGGNLYFSIKDEGAVLSCVKFGANGGYIPKEGEQVLLVGSPNYYVKGGRFSFNVAKIEPYGQGVLYQKFLEMKQKLEALGMFDSANKKPLPQIIKRIGVVSSETGAVIQDIIDITSRRNPMLDIVLYPAKVQGIGAEQTIIAGLSALDQTDVDVIIIARGGGSQEDLATFNDEALAHAIFNTKKPVISAVGHETDFTIADFVADLRAPTPSAAAELVASDINQLKANLLDNTKRLLNLTKSYYDDQYNNIGFVSREIYNAANHILNEKSTQILTNILGLKLCSEKVLQQKIHSFELLINKLEGLNPIKLLKMGYSQVSKSGDLVKSVEQIKIDDSLDINFVDGVISCVVTAKKEKK